MAAGARQMRSRAGGSASTSGRGATRSVAAPGAAKKLRPTRAPRAAATDAAAAAASAPTAWLQRTVTLKEKARGVHLVTRELLEQGVQDDLSAFDVGLANFHLLHTSAGLSINENACSAVRRDMARFFDALVPDGNKGAARYEHDDEGPDDMPAHIKGVLTGFTLTVPITRGRLALGTWQGIYLFESRDRGGERSIVVTLQGTRRADGRRYG